MSVLTAAKRGKWTVAKCSLCCTTTHCMLLQHILLCARGSFGTEVGIRCVSEFSPVVTVPGGVDTGVGGTSYPELEYSRLCSQKEE